MTSADHDTTTGTSSTQRHTQPGDEAARTRGQLILVSCLVLAASLVFLVVVLNSVLYTENLAAREQPQELTRAQDTVSFLDRTTTRIVHTQNTARKTTDRAAVTSTSHQLANVTTTLSSHVFTSHQTVLDTNTSLHQAWVVTQPTASPVTPAYTRPADSADQPWQLAEANGIRNASLTVTSAPEINTSATDQADELPSVTISEAGTGSSSWTVWLYEREDAAGIGISTTLNAQNTPITECETTTQPARLDFVTMTLADTSCSLSFARGVTGPNYAVEFENGNTLEARYQFVLGQGNGATLGTNGSATATHDPTTGDEPDDRDPTAYDGVYAVRTMISHSGPVSTTRTILYTAPRQPAATRATSHP